MKRIVALFFAVLFSFMIVPMGSASAETEEVVYFEDGSYCVTTITYSGERATNKRTGSKVKAYYDSESTKLFSLTVHGSFNYDGSTVTCIDASYTYEIYDSAWSLKSATASKSGATATASGTFVKKVLGITVNTITLTPTLTCDKDGNLS